MVLSTLCLLLWNLTDHKRAVESLPPELTDVILSHLIFRTMDIQVSLRCLSTYPVCVLLNITTFCCLMQQATLEVSTVDVPIMYILCQQKNISSRQFFELSNAMKPILETAGGFRWAIILFFALYVSNLRSTEVLKLRSDDISQVERYLTNTENLKEVAVVFRSLLMIPENRELLIANGFIDKLTDMQNTSDDKDKTETIGHILDILLDKKP